MYTGKWVCYLSKFLTYYGGIYVQTHSLIIGLLKYFTIVRWKRVNLIGQEKVKTIFFWLNMFHPAGLILLHVLIVPDFFLVWDAYSHVDRCLGDPDNNWVPNSNSTQTKLHTICINLVQNLPETNLDCVIYIFRSCFCWLQLSYVYFVLWNIPEIFVYSAIFLFMNR